MRRQRTMWDFFSGLGGASEAFRRTGWHVVTVDNDPMFKPTVLRDVRELNVNDVTPPDFAWFSPPCVEFALRRFDPTIVPSLELVEASVRIIKQWEAKNHRFYWALENVRHSVPFISRILGPHRLAVGSFFLWGNFPMFLPPQVENKGSPQGPHWLRSATRAKIPLALSAEMEEAVHYTLNALESADVPLAQNPSIQPAQEPQLSLFGCAATRPPAAAGQEPEAGVALEPSQEPPRAPEGGLEPANA